ncbi:MAG: DUF488 family protein, N3 subclade [Solirubrobacteraceae bacterium]
MQHRRTALWTGSRRPRISRNALRGSGRRCRGELQTRDDAIKALRTRGRKGRVTLLFGARDAARNNVAVLAEVVGDAR